MPQVSAVKLPSTGSLEKCMEIITDPEAAKFFHQRLEEQFTKAKVSQQFSDLLNDTQKYAQSIGDQSPNSQAWSGQNPVVKSSFQVYQSKLATESVEKLSHQNIHFDFALSDDAEIIRAYTDDNGQAVSNDESQTLDSLFNAWLAEHGYLTKEGVICEANADGSVKKENNQNKKADAERVRELITDSKEGFTKYVESKSDSLKIEAVKHEHPSDAEKKSAQQATPS